VRRSNIVPLTRLAPAGLGFAFGLYFVLSSVYLHASLWPVWAPLVVAFTTAAGAVFTYGLDCWDELSRYGKVRVRAVVPRVAAIGAVFFLVVLGSTRLSGPAQSNWRGVELTAILSVGGVTAVGVMEGIRLTIADDSLPHAGGEQTIVLIRLRQLLQRLLAAVGSLVTLSTLATGADLAMERSVPVGFSSATSTPLPPQFVLVFGGVGSLLVGLFYVPGAAALQRRGQRLCDELFPLNEATEASAILSLAEDRNKLEQLLGADRGAFADLQTGLAILGPLLVSAAAAFLSP
jgi:hypothetical protein